MVGHGRTEALPSTTRAVAVFGILWMSIALPLKSTPFVVTLPLALFLLLGIRHAWRAGRAPQSAASSRLERSTELAALGVLVAGITLAGLLLLDDAVPGDPWLSIALLLVAAALALAAVQGSRVAFWGHVVVQATIYALVLPQFPFLSDVPIYLRDSAAGLLEGDNPYGLTFPNPFSAELSERYFAPEFVDGDRILIGFPYLPTAAVAAIPGHLLGDVRLSLVAALAGTSLIVRLLAQDRTARMLAVAVMLNPLPLLVVTQAWIEPLLGTGLALVVWGMARERAWAVAVGSVVLLTTKQYVVVVVPLALVILRRFGWRLVALVVAVSALVLAAFVAAGPSDFWHSVVVVQLKQPFRPDSISLAVDVARVTGTSPHSLLSVLSLVAGVLVATLVAVRAPSTGSWLAWGFSFSLLATVLLSKQSFANYYCLIQTGLMLAAVGRPANRDPEHH